MNTTQRNQDNLDYLDSKGEFTRWFDNDTKEDFWICNRCGCEDVDPYDNFCAECSDDDEPLFE